MPTPLSSRHDEWNRHSCCIHACMSYYTADCRTAIFFDVEALRSSIFRRGLPPGLRKTCGTFVRSPKKTTSVGGLFQQAARLLLRVRYPGWNVTRREWFMAAVAGVLREQRLLRAARLIEQSAASGDVRAAVLDVRQGRFS